jgi:hypothetical protein
MWETRRPSSMAVNKGVNVHLVVVAAFMLPHAIDATDARPGRPGRAFDLVVRLAQAKADKGIPRCRPGPVDNYLAADAERCWYGAPHGRWRLLRHELHYYTVVIEVEADSLDDADEIARRLVENLKDTGQPANEARVRFREVMVYVQQASAAKESPIRRIRWTQKAGYETLTFVGSLRR